MPQMWQAYQTAVQKYYYTDTNLNYRAEVTEYDKKSYVSENMLSHKIIWSRH